MLSGVQVSWITVVRLKCALTCSLGEVCRWLCLDPLCRGPTPGKERTCHPLSAFLTCKLKLWVRVQIVNPYSNVGYWGPIRRVLRHIQLVGILLEDGAVVIGVHDGNTNCSCWTQGFIIFIYGDHLFNKNPFQNWKYDPILSMQKKITGLCFVLLSKPFAVLLQNPVVGAA